MECRKKYYFGRNFWHSHAITIFFFFLFWNEKVELTVENRKRSPYPGNNIARPMRNWLFFFSNALTIFYFLRYHEEIALYFSYRYILNLLFFLAYILCFTILSTNFFLSFFFEKKMYGEFFLFFSFLNYLSVCVNCVFVSCVQGGSIVTL